MCLRSKGKAAFTNLIFYTKANSIHSTHNTKQLYMFSEKLIHLTVKIYWSFHMSCILLFHTSSGSVPMTPPYEMGPTVIPILPTRHPKNRKAKQLEQCHTAIKSSQPSYQHSLAPECMLSTVLNYCLSNSFYSTLHSVLIASCFWEQFIEHSEALYRDVVVWTVSLQMMYWKPNPWYLQMRSDLEIGSLQMQLI